MPSEFQLPDLGENIEAGDVVKVLVKKGDRIDKQQPVLELETDKAVIEVPSSVVGTVQRVHVKEGERIAVGQAVLTVDGGSDQAGEEAAGATAKKDQKKEAAEPASRAADRKQEKSGKERPNETRGKGKKSGTGSSGSPGAAVVDFKASRGASAPVSGGAEVPAAPSVRRFARQIGVNLVQVRGTGPRGRISIDDVKKHSRLLNQSGRAEVPAAQAALPDFSQWGEVERIQFTNVRRKTAEHMTRAWLSVPHVTQYDEADITALEAARKKYGRRIEEAGGKLTVTAVVLKVVAAALREFPQFNASIDVANEEVVYKKYCHIGVAVDTERGLLVPVIRDVDEKELLDLSVELTQLAQRARSAKLTLEEMQGGSFTVSNLGGIGGTNFSPIVNWPEAAILGLSRARMAPVYQGGQFAPRLMLPLSLSYDHRLIDGADAIRFLRWVAEALEYPLSL